MQKSRFRNQGLAMLAVAGALAFGGGAMRSIAQELPASTLPAPKAMNPHFAASCDALSGNVSAAIGRIESARPGDAMLPMLPGQRAAIALPAHCDVHGILQERIGENGQHYAIRYHMRLPQDWNGRFLFQGGGGTNGEVGDASGPAGIGVAPAIARGFAVISQDSGHDNRLNVDPDRGGTAVFGTDPQARANYGYASLPLATRAGKALVTAFYGKQPDHSYFFGCSKGGQEGMALAHRFPKEFDGIVAEAPGFALPRAALSQAWSIQQFAALAQRQSLLPATPATIARTFSPADLGLVHGAILAGCDAADGLVDGLTSNLRACTTATVMPHLRQLTCKGDKTTTCLASDQVDTLARVMAGPKNRQGAPLYSRWAWDAGVGSPMWSAWRLGTPSQPARDITLGGASLPTVFSVPPQAVQGTPDALLAFELGLRFPEAEQRILNRTAQFPHSAWEDIAMRSPDIDGFLARGGKLLVPHGAADPVFSVEDSIAWWDEVKARYGARTDDLVKLFVVPGMAHCGGGPTTDQFDMLTALVAWVERGAAPQNVEATAGPNAPWPGRTRPLCAWPRFAAYDKGDPNRASSFVCKLDATAAR